MDENSDSGCCIYYDFRRYSTSVYKLMKLAEHLCSAQLVEKLRERPLLQGVPSFKTVHWTVLKFTLCGAPEGCMQGFAPHPTRGAASGLCQRDIVPLESHY